MRIFIAISLSNILRKKIGLFTDELKVELGQKYIRWVNPSGMHLTLKFLGETPPQQVEGIIDTIAEITKKTRKFEMRVSGLGCFPSCERPRVLSLGIVEPSGELRTLQQDMEAKLHKAGIERERRKFHPHLTLGRIRKGASLAAVKSLGQEIKTRVAVDLGTESVVEISLLKSRLQPRGAVYSVLSKHALGIFN